MDMVQPRTITATAWTHQRLFETMLDAGLLRRELYNLSWLGLYRENVIVDWIGILTLERSLDMIMGILSAGR